MLYNFEGLKSNEKKELLVQLLITEFSYKSGKKNYIDLRGLDFKNGKYNLDIARIRNLDGNISQYGHSNCGWIDQTNHKNGDYIQQNKQKNIGRIFNDDNDGSTKIINNEIIKKLDDIKKLELKLEELNEKLKLVFEEITYIK